MGIIVDDYSSKPAGTYQDTVTFTAKVEDAIVHADPETLATNTSASVYTGANVKISVQDKGDKDGFRMSSAGNRPTATIEALNGTKIDKVEVTRGYYYIDVLTTNKGTIAISGDVATISDIDDTSVVLSASGSAGRNAEIGRAHV